MDSMVLQARIIELERELQYLRTQNAELIKYKEDIFYKWTKDDFIDMFMNHISNINESYTPSKEVFKKYWELWKDKFDENWSSSECHDQMMNLLEELMEEYPLLITTSE